MYLRIIPVHFNDDNLERDNAAIGQILLDYPWVTSIEPFEPHPRGGYKLFFDCPTDKMEDLCVKLAEAGFRPAV